MKPISKYCLVVMTACYGLGIASSQEAASNLQLEETVETVDTLLIKDPMATYESLRPEVNEDIVNLSFMPLIFSGYRKVHDLPEYSDKKLYDELYGFLVVDGDVSKCGVEEELNADLDEVVKLEVDTIQVIVPEIVAEAPATTYPSLLYYDRPQWFKQVLRDARLQQDIQYLYMINNPMYVDYAYWDLPAPPVLLVEDRSFLAFLLKQDIPEVDPEDAVLPDTEVPKRHWLHKFNAQLQFSQAYVSPNWYQGGNSYLSLLFGFNWNVQLNQVYHPNLLFQSDLTYKAALTSNPKGYLHKYTIAEDNFQYNLNTGLKAAKDWYYSFNLQFKTQLFNNYEQDSNTQTAAFLSPGDLNMGLGMSYNHKNKVNTFSYTLTISPLSYNLKTCIVSNDKILHSTYGIDPDKRAKSEIGSNIEFVMNWAICSNISYKTRVFMFSDYKYYMADWQNTISFDINKFLSTQVFVHLRYDGSTESYGSWKKFMLREILSFGLSYTFSTKP